jgi:hypothetical protein
MHAHIPLSLLITLVHVRAESAPPSPLLGGDVEDFGFQTNINESFAPIVVVTGSSP